MHTLLALVLTVVTSVVIARPPGPLSTTTSQEEPALPPTRKYLKEYSLPRFLWPHYFTFDDNPEEVQPVPVTEWLNKEIQRLGRQKMTFKPKLPRRMPQSSPNYIRWADPYTMRGAYHHHYDYEQSPALDLVSERAMLRDRKMNGVKQFVPVAPETINATPLNEEDKKKVFALTPLDQGYFEPIGKYSLAANLTSEAMREDGGERAPHVAHPELEPEPPRYTRQNPNLSRHNLKSLVAEDLDVLRKGFEPAHDEQRSHVSRLESATGSPNTFYGVALLSAIGVAAVLAVMGFAFGWYTLSKRAKAAADVDYPAYGVTGPTVDPSGDRKLAHSAHMYHYQHQKQQIIAMERNGMEQRSGSVTDPESDEENEEGDYTVYECPGFATTGDMEVKNPLFNEEPTPATPGKREVMKPQPKD